MTMHVQPMTWAEILDHFYAWLDSPGAPATVDWDAVDVIRREIRKDPEWYAWASWPNVYRSVSAS